MWRRACDQLSVLVGGGYCQPVVSWVVDAVVVVCVVGASGWVVCVVAPSWSPKVRRIAAVTVAE